MDKILAHRLLDLLGSERRLVHYWPGREAALLLRLAHPQGARIGELKQSRFAPLLQRPQVKPVMAAAGDGVLRGEALDVWPADKPWFCHALGFRLWGASKKGAARDKQVSRPGYSLALLLNFSGAHDAYFRAWFGDDAGRLFTSTSHPHDGSGRRTTCAWVRIDISPQTGEALIEEVQNDWLRNARSDYAWARMDNDKRSPESQRRARNIVSYWETIGVLHESAWKEAALSAALVVLVETVGVRTIYMHTSAAGARLKRIGGTLPPRSVYEDLPRRFCFERTCAAPRFLLDDVSKPMRRFLKSGEAEFWRHQF